MRIAPVEVIEIARLAAVMTGAPTIDLTPGVGLGMGLEFLRTAGVYIDDLPEGHAAHLAGLAAIAGRHQPTQASAEDGMHWLLEQLLGWRDRANHYDFVDKCFETRKPDMRGLGQSYRLVYLQRKASLFWTGNLGQELVWTLRRWKRMDLICPTMERMLPVRTVFTPGDKSLVTVEV